MQSGLLNKVTLSFWRMSNFCKLFYNTPPLFYAFFFQLPIFLLCFVASTNAWYYNYGYGHHWSPYYHNIKIHYGPKIEPTSYDQYVQVTYKCSVGTDEELDSSDVANNPNCDYWTWLPTETHTNQGSYKNRCYLKNKRENFTPSDANYTYVSGAAFCNTYSINGPIGNWTFWIRHNTIKI